MTGMDVGELYASVRIDTGNVAGDLKKVKDGLDGVRESAEKVENKRLKIDADDRPVKDAKRATEDLGTAADNAASKSSKIRFPTQYTRDAEQAKSAIDGAVDSIGKMATNAVKWGGLTAATTAIAGIGTALTKGYSRLDALDQAKAKLEALGNSGSTVQQVMDNALASVKGTAFGIGDAAGTAAVLVGAGVKPGQELERTLKLVADSAAIAGISFGEMGSIWGKVASNTVLSGEEMAQISDRSIGLQVALAEKFGVTALEAKKMVSEGKVSFEDFSDAMESLVGGGAVRMGDTVSGAIDNLGAAFGRAGAQVLESGFEAAPGILADLTTAVDGMGAQLAPVAAEWGQKLTPVVAEFAANVGPNAAAAFGMIGDAVGVTAPLIGKIADGLGAIPFPVAVGGLAALISQHKGWTGQLADGAGKLGGFSKELGGGLVGAFAKATSATKDSDSALGGLAKGGLSLAKSGMGGLKDAAGGLVSALGGPWGIAIGGASIALGYLAEQHFAAKKAEEEHKAAQLELKGTLDDTTGAITAQTRELQLKRAEENGWLETATKLGISQNTLIDAMSGNERAQQMVNAAVSAGTTAAIEASAAWEKYGGNFQNAGIDAETLAAALDGNAEAQQKVTKAASEYTTAFGPGLQSQLNSIRAEVDDTTDAFGGLSDGVGQSAADLDAMRSTVAEQNLAALREQVDTTRGALELLGNTDLKLTKDGIKIPFDQVSEDTLTKLEEIHGITSTTIDGEVTLEFPEGVDVLAVLESIGVELDSLDGGHIDINTDDPEAAKALLEEIGVLTKFEDGQLRIDTNAPGVIDILVELGILVADPMTGEVTIDDTSIMTSDERMRTLADAVKAGAKGKVEMEDNAKEVSRNIDRELQGKKTRGTHEIWEQYYSTGRVASTSGTSVGQHYRAAGGRAPAHADGGRLPTTGPGTDRTDGILGIGTDGVPTTWVDAGEWIINRRRSDKFDATLNAINSGDEDQILYAALNDLQRLETGGRVDIKSQLASMNGTPYIFGGWSPAGVDCSGAVSLVANAATGRDPWDGRTSTHTMGPFLTERGFVPGKGGPGSVTVGWKNGGPGGGHTAVTLADGTNIESGGNTGQGFTIGGRAASGHDSQFTDFMHLPLADQAGWAGGGGTAGGFSGGGSWTTGGQASTYMRTFQPMEIKEGDSGVGSTFGMNHDPAPEITGDFTRIMTAEIDDAIRRNGLDDLAAQHGMTASLEQAAGAVKDALSNAKIWLSVSPETIEAFNTLGEAQEDRKEAAFNVAQAEKELERARLDAGHSAEDYADQIAAAEKRVAEARESGSDKIADAEKNLAKARESGKPEDVEKAQKALNKAMSDAPDKIADAEKSLAKLLRDGPTKASDSADRVAEAEQRLTDARLAEERSIAKLEQAQLAYNHALQMAPIKAVQGLLTKVADGFSRLGEVLDTMSQQQERLTALSMSRVDAEIGLVRSQLSLQQAQAAHAQAQRAITNGQWQDTLSLQQAEWALSNARLGSGATTYEMAMLESAVSDQKAQNDLASFERSYALAEAAADLEYAEYIATAQAAQLTIAIDAAAKAQAGLYGIHTHGMDALGSVVKGIGQVVAGVVKFVGGLAGLAAAAAQFSVGSFPTAIATAAASLPAIGSGVNDMVAGVSTIKANKDEARKQWDNLDLGGKVGVGVAVGGAVLSGFVGGAAALGGGSIDDANSIVTGIQDTSNVIINAITADREARIDAAEREAKRKQDALDLENKKRELEHLQGQLARAEAATPERERLQALADAAAKALAEAQQKHQQNMPTTPAPEMAGTPGTVFFQVGGAGWESMSTTNRVLAEDGGFAGITPDTLGAFESSWDAGGGVSSAGIIPKMPEVLAKGADAQTTTAEATQGMWAELAYVSRVIERIEKQMGAGGQRVGAVFNGPVTMPNAQEFVEDQLSAQVRQSLAR